MDIEKMKAAALAASAEPWSYTGPEYGDGGGIFHRVESPVKEIVGEFGPSEENAIHIAASCPAAVLELIAEVERLRNLAPDESMAAARGGSGWTGGVGGGGNGSDRNSSGGGGHGPGGTRVAWPESDCARDGGMCACGGGVCGKQVASGKE